MTPKRLDDLVRAYRNAPEEFHATTYWRAYEKAVDTAVRTLDMGQIRSGRYPVLGTFGFGDVVYYNHPFLPGWKKALYGLAQSFFAGKRALLPYKLSLTDVREMAYRHAELTGECSFARPLRDLEMSLIGNPTDVFEAQGRKYSILFLNYYIRYCFAQKQARFGGDETIVELGSGSGYQAEILKKLYPDMTILCFDLPVQIFLCEEYLSRVFNETGIVSARETAGWTDLSRVKKGSIHFFGNWQFPLMRGYRFDVFWNAASFGEMEPRQVENYLSYVKNNARWIYLLQARRGKETTGKARVRKPIRFEDYVAMLPGYALVEQQDAFLAHRKFSESGGYFQAIFEVTVPVLGVKS